jgi:enamine deaminase RidA (YjgF/YER057c/UK114 family)
MLRSVGSDLDHVVHVNVFLKEMADFDAMNAAYVESMGDHRPARTVIGVRELPKPGVPGVTTNLTAVSSEPRREPLGSATRRSTPAPRPRPPPPRDHPFQIAPAGSIPWINRSPGDRRNAKRASAQAPRSAPLGTRRCAPVSPPNQRSVVARSVQVVPRRPDIESLHDVDDSRAHRSSPSRHGRRLKAGTTKPLAGPEPRAHHHSVRAELAAADPDHPPRHRRHTAGFRG